MPNPNPNPDSIDALHIDLQPEPEPEPEPHATCDHCGVGLADSETCWRDDYAYCAECLPNPAAGYDGELAEYHAIDPRDLGWFTACGVAREPEPGRRYFGVELEYECPGDSPGDVSYDVHRAFGRGRCIVSSDGSLTEGLELVTAPADYGTMHTWLLDFRAPAACRVKRSCGMHVHVSRNTVSPLNLGKVLIFVNAEKNRGLIDTMARRSETPFCKKAERKWLSDPWRHDRYQAVNTANRGTIEFRLFAGTRTPWKAAAALESVQAILEFCEQESVRALGVADFVSWLAKRQSQYKNLVKLLSREGWGASFRRVRVKREPVNTTAR